METYEERVDAGIYSREALKLASFIVSHGRVYVSGKNGKITVRVKAEKAELFFKKLMNEALNQQCRIDVARNNSKIARLIVTKSLLSALGK